MTARSRDRDPVEMKFNPYHDSSNGQFTFGPGGGAARSGAGARTGRQIRFPAMTLRSPATAAGRFDDGVYRPAQAGSLFKPVQYRPSGFGSNIRAFQDPMTLQEVFPGAQNAPGGSIIALGDTLLDFTGPRNAMTTSLSKQYSMVIIDQIKAIDPGYRCDSFQFPVTFQGQMNEITNSKLTGQKLIFGYVVTPSRFKSKHYGFYSGRRTKRMTKA